MPIGALILAGHDPATGKLRYAGTVSAGLGAHISRNLADQFSDMHAPTPPWRRRSGRVDDGSGSAVWLRPGYGAAVEYREYTIGGRFRHLSFKHLTFFFDYEARTSSGGTPSPRPSWTAIWTMRSACNTPTHCIATGSDPQSLPHAMVLESAGDTWQSLSPTIFAGMCTGLPVRALAISELSLDTSDRQAIRGTQTVTILSNECGDKGAVYSAPVTVQKVTDKPGQDIEIANPALFLP